MYQKNIKNCNNGYDIVVIWNKKADIEELSYSIIGEDMRRIFLNSGLKNEKISNMVN